MDTAQARKARGAFFTPKIIADFLVRWAVRDPKDSVLEPSCGDAEFLTSVVRRLRSLGAKRIRSKQLRGVELHASSAEEAKRRVRDAGAEADITTGDFFDFNDGELYDAVPGNPPFIRYQEFGGSARAKARLAALRQGVELTGLASSWAAFVVHAASFVKPDGRLALVVPAELLTVNYAASVRRFLLRRFGSVKLVLFEELVFPGVQEEVLLLLAEGSGPSTHFELTQVRDLGALAEIESLKWIKAPEEAEGKLTLGLIPEEARAAYLRATTSASFGNLLDWGDVSLGMVTGNNKFFMLSKEAVRRAGLRDSELMAMSPPGSKHLRGLTFSMADWQRMLAEGARVYLFYPRRTSRLSQAAKTVIKSAEKEGVHEGYKCRNRTPWWRVPLVRPPHLFLTYMNDEAPYLCTNRAGVRFVNSVHGVYLRKGLTRLGRDLLPLAALNTVTLLGAEVVGRAYGGGILKLEPKEADLLPVPSPELLRRLRKSLSRIRRPVRRFLRSGDLNSAIELVDSVVLDEGLGMPHEVIDDLRKSRELLFARRAARGR